MFTLTYNIFFVLTDLDHVQSAKINRLTFTNEFSAQIFMNMLRN